jgi:hypothetical protein
MFKIIVATSRTNRNKILEQNFVTKHFGTKILSMKKQNFSDPTTKLIQAAHKFTF